MSVAGAQLESAGRRTRASRFLKIIIKYNKTVTLARDNSLVQRNQMRSVGHSRQASRGAAEFRVGFGLMTMETNLNFVLK